MTVNHLKLSLPLKAKYKRVPALPVLRNCCVQLGQALQAGQFVEHKPDGCLVLLRRGQKSHDQQINPKAMQRTQRLAFCRTRCDEDPTGAGLGPLRGTPRFAARLLPGRQHPKAVRNQSKRSKNAVALLLRALGNHGFHLRPAYTQVNLCRVGEPRNQFLRCRTFGKEMGENLLRRLGEKLALLVAGRLVKRGCNRLRLSLAPQLFGRPPVGATVVQRVQYNVATFFRIEALNKFASRVVDDGRVASALNLPKYLHDERCLARARVSHQLDVLRLCLKRYPHHLFCFSGFEADTVSVHRLVELLGREHDRPLEQPAVLQFLAALDVFRDRKRKLRQQRKEPKQKRKLVDVPQLVAVINAPLQVLMQSRVKINLLRAAIQSTESLTRCRSRKCQWNLLASWRGSRAILHVAFNGQPPCFRSVADVKQLVFAVLLECAACCCPRIDGRIKLLQGRLAEAETKVQKAAGQHEREEHRAVTVDRRMWREDDRLFAAPVGCCHSG